MDILKRIIFHALLEIDCIEYLNSISILQKCISTFIDDCTLWICYYI